MAGPPGLRTAEKRRVDLLQTPARLVFEGVQSVDGLPGMASVPRSRDADGSQDFGSLSELTGESGAFVIAGDFGVVHVRAASVRLEITARPNEGAAPDRSSM